MDWGVIETGKQDDVTFVGHHKVIKVSVGPNPDGLSLAAVAEAVGHSGGSSSENLTVGQLPGRLERKGTREDECVAVLAVGKEVVYQIVVQDLPQKRFTPHEPVCEILRSFTVEKSLTWMDVMQGRLKSDPPPWDTDNNAGRHWEQAGRLLNQGKIVEAEAEYRACIRFAPYDARPRNKLAIILSAGNRVSEAIAEARVAVYRDPKTSKYRSILASAYHQQKQIGLATEEFLRAIELDPTDPSPHYGMAKLLGSMEQWQSAANEMREVVRLSGDREEYKNLRELALKAIPVFEK
jgi:hypothetical protein